MGSLFREGSKKYICAEVEVEVEETARIKFQVLSLKYDKEGNILGSNWHGF